MASSSTVRSLIRSALLSVEPVHILTRRVVGPNNQHQYELLFKAPLPGPTLTFFVGGESPPTPAVVQSYKVLAWGMWRSAVIEALPLLVEEDEDK